MDSYPPFSAGYCPRSSPGPGSISEALAKKLPVIVRRNAWTLAHERFNADWVEGQGLGLVVNSFREIGAAVAKMIEPASFERFRCRVAAKQNFAVYEIPDMLERVLANKELGPARRSARTSTRYSGTASGTQTQSHPSIA